MQAGGEGRRPSLLSGETKATLSDLPETAREDAHEHTALAVALHPCGPSLRFHGNPPSPLVSSG